MSRYEIQQEDFSGFFQVPFEVYPNSPFVSLFKPDLKRFLSRTENPLFSKHGEFTYFVVYRDGKPVGRVVAHIHHASNQRHGLKWSYFGFFDCDNDEIAARRLLEAAEAWGRSKGAEQIVGNMNLTAMQQLGVMTDLFENVPYSDQVYSPPHIAKLLEKNGYQAFFPSTTFELDLQSLEPATLRNGRIEKCQESGIEIRSATLANLKQEMEQARLVLNAGFDKNPFFVPVTHEEFHFQAKDMMWVIDPKITKLAYSGDECVGIVICIPDLNPLLKATRSRLLLSTVWHFLKFRFLNRRAVIIYYSVRPEAQGAGVAGLMLYEVVKSLKQRRYEKLGITWIADENIASLKQMQRLGAKPLHRLHLFKKELL